MATNLEKQALASAYSSKGYVVLKRMFHPYDIHIIWSDAMSVFEKQFEEKGYEGGFLDRMKLLFTLDNDTFQNCGKHAQHLINLWKLSLSDKVIELLQNVGMQWPNVCTRPVLMFNHPDLAKEKVYHTMDAHQDWPSMQGSDNAAVLWVPLMKMEKQNGTLRILPGSHTLLREAKMDGAFAMVDLKEGEKMIDIELEIGDALLFHSKLVHSSGENTSGNIRWSAHFRYNDLGDKEFVKRGYPHPYVYRSILQSGK